MRYMSIITNFGCHYKCPYCIVKENNLHIPRTTLAGLDNLEEALKRMGAILFLSPAVETHSMSMRSTLTGIESYLVLFVNATLTVAHALFLWKCTPAT